MTKKNMFCAQCVAEVEHVFDIDRNLEVIATCPKGHFVKFPSVGDVKSLQAHIDGHVAANKESMEMAAAHIVKRISMQKVLEGLK